MRTTPKRFTCNRFHSIIFLSLVMCLSASPVFAALSVYLERVGTGITPALVDVKYSGADANSQSTMPRSFALKIRTNNQAKIIDVNNYQIGESNSVKKIFGIYPATIDINSAGGIVSYSKPLAASDDPGAVGSGLDTNNVVLEFHSLYYGDANAPASAGKLCTLYIEQNGASGSSTVSMTDEDVYRGGLVFEDGSQGNTGDASPQVYIYWVPCDFKAQIPFPANGTTDVSRAGVTLTWTAATCIVPTSHDVYFGTTNPPPLKGNQAGIGYATGAMTQGKLYYWRIDERNVVGVTTGDVWSFTVEECLASTASGYGYWKLVGKPNCFCYRRHCRGDSNGSSTANKPVTATDFTNFVAGYNTKYTRMINKYDINGVHILCGDYNHTVVANIPVAATDWTIFMTYFNLRITQGVPECPPGTNINFWMN